MSVTETNIHEIQAKINPLLGKKSREVNLGVGSFITVDFGKPMPPRGKKGLSRGEWLLWVYCCAWRLEEGDEVIAGSEDTRSKLETAVKRLEGLAIESVVLLPPAFETILTFEGKVVLHLFPVHTEEYEHWMLYTPDENVLTIGPGTSWSYASAHEITTQE